MNTAHESTMLILNSSGQLGYTFGNVIFTDKSPDRICIITGLQLEENKVFYKTRTPSEIDLTANAQNIQPVPITVDRMEHLAVRKVYKQDYYTCASVSTMVSDNAILKHIKIYEKENDIWLLSIGGYTHQIYYIHEIQNIFYYFSHGKIKMVWNPINYTGE